MNCLKPQRYNEKLHKLLRLYSVTKPKIIADEEVIKSINDGIQKPRNHPGIFKPKTVSVPDSLLRAIQNVTEDAPLKAIFDESEKLDRHLKAKQIPLEKNELRRKTQQIHKRLNAKYENFIITNEEDEKRHAQRLNENAKNIASKEIYNWKPINYDAYNCLVYLIGRVSSDYAVLYKIFAEIAQRDPKFQPKSLFDFGSGIGTVTWATMPFWKKSIFEYFNVDISGHMNDLAQLLLQDGRNTKKMSLSGVFYRQFLPHANIKYDLVVSAYSLLELPSRQARLQTILTLWNKTHNYLVIVEQGTLAGFHIINEVREFILHSKTNEMIPAHIFSPCPHDNVCPRYSSNDETPCNFEMQYTSLPIGTVSRVLRERYCYVVIKKRHRLEDDPQWPRIVRPTLVRSKHSICRVCTKYGKLDEFIFTSAKHGKATYHCARSSKWGDLLPMQTEENVEEDLKNNENES